MHEAAAEAEAVQDADMPNLEEAEEELEGRILREDMDYARNYARRAEEEGRILREEHIGGLRRLLQMRRLVQMRRRQCQFWRKLGRARRALSSMSNRCI